MPKEKLQEPYVSKYCEVGDFIVWEVDGRYIRNNMDREFTNFGQHYRFKFIPKMEFWIDKPQTPGEEKLFISHLIKEWDLMDLGMGYPHALEIADKLEQKERIKTKLMERIKTEIPDPKKEIPKELYVHKLEKYSKEADVWIVKGELVRGLYFIDFTEGGHHFVYDFVPVNEVWIDDDLSPSERGFIILHELHERFLMAQGMEYHKAHLSSSIIEYKCRRNPGLLEDSLTKEFAKNETISSLV